MNEQIDEMCKTGSTDPRAAAFERMWMLTFYGPGGGLVGFYWHPNRLAVEEKQRECAADFPRWTSRIDAYVPEVRT